MVTAGVDLGRYRISRLQPRANFGKRQILEGDKFWRAAHFESRQILGSGNFGKGQILDGGKF